MTSQSKPGWRRMPTKTHGAFEAIPSLRVPGKDLPPASSPSRNASGVSTNSPKKPAQYADPTLFPGRRLDRRQHSNYSGVSGQSGLTGLDQLTLNSSGRFRTAGSIAGSTKVSSLPSVTGMPNNRAFHGDDPWGSARHTREDSPLTMLRRQATSTLAGSEGEGGKSGGGLGGISFPAQSSFSKVSRWQHANFPTIPPVNNRNSRPVSFETRETLMESPDSMESHDSELQPPVDHGLLFEQHLRRKQQQEREARQLHMQRHARGRYTPPPPVLQDNDLPSQQERSARHINPHRRPAETPAVSPTPSGPGPQLNKILWALVPDEHASNSEAAQSHHPKTHTHIPGTSAAGESGRFVTVTDLDADSENTRHEPETPRNPTLTEKILLGHNESTAWSRDDRIFQWLSECDKETTSQSLPTHLPDIKYTFKFLKSVT